MLDLIWYQHFVWITCCSGKDLVKTCPIRSRTDLDNKTTKSVPEWLLWKPETSVRVRMWSTLLSLFGHGFSLQTFTTALERSWHQKNYHACDGKAKGKGYYQWTRNNNQLAFRFKMKLDFAIVGAGLADSSQFPGTGVEARRTAWAR